MTFLRFLPVLLLTALLGLFTFTLVAGQRLEQSPLQDQPMPAFDLPDAQQAEQRLSSATLKKPALLVFWASWCGVCKIDMPILSQFAQDHHIPLYAIAYRDQPQALAETVKQFGRAVSFTALARDDSGDVSSAYGLIGVPTLFAIDAQGIVRAVVPGQVSAEELKNDVLPLLY